MTAIERLRGAGGIRRGVALVLPALAAAMLWMGAPAVHAEGHQADSDDYVCNHGAPDDPTTIEACGHLRGTTRGIGRDLGHQRSSDDFNCNHGAADDPATLEACQRLRGTTYGAGVRDIGHQRNSDDWVCHHGPPGDPATEQACAHMRGYAEAARHGHISVIHVVRDYPTARRGAGGRSYLSARFTIELNCEAGVRRRVAVVHYAGRHGTGARVDSGRIEGAWRAAAGACG
jgi:hypothetical protein